VNLWHDVRLLNLTANALFALAAAALLAGLVGWMVTRPAFALRAVVVEPAAETVRLRHVNDIVLRTAGVHRVQGGFFTVNLAAVRESFETVPWVRRAQVRRIWPNALRIGIEEHEPLATWSDGRLVNRYGELFVANVAEAEDEADLLEFAGPGGSEQLVTRQWAALSRQIEPLQLKLESVSLSPRYAWSARLDNGITLLLGRDQELPVVDRVARWVELYPQVHLRLNRHAETVDLRYPNGFAVRVPGALDTPAPDRQSPTRAAAPARMTNSKDKRSP
jgi:cell division protein FtsQ